MVAISVCNMKLPKALLGQLYDPLAWVVRKCRVVLLLGSLDVSQNNDK